jgi:hypothetical protein
MINDSLTLSISPLALAINYIRSIPNIVTEFWFSSLALRKLFNVAPNLCKKRDEL